MKHGKCTLTTGKMTKDPGMVFILHLVKPGWPRTSALDVWAAPSAPSLHSWHVFPCVTSQLSLQINMYISGPFFFSITFSPLLAIKQNAGLRRWLLTLLLWLHLSDLGAMSYYFIQCPVSGKGQKRRGKKIEYSLIQNIQCSNFLFFIYEYIYVT